MIEFRKNWSDEKLDIVMNEFNDETLKDVNLEEDQVEIEEK